MNFKTTTARPTAFSVAVKNSGISQQPILFQPPCRQAFCQQVYRERWRVRWLKDIARLAVEARQPLALHRSCAVRGSPGPYRVALNDRIRGKVKETQGE